MVLGEVQGAELLEVPAQGFAGQALGQLHQQHQPLRAGDEGPEGGAQRRHGARDPEVLQRLLEDPQLVVGQQLLGQDLQHHLPAAAVCECVRIAFIARSSLGSRG